MPFLKYWLNLAYQSNVFQELLFICVFMYCISVGSTNIKIQFKVIVWSLDLKWSGFIFCDLNFLWSGLILGNTRLLPAFYEVAILDKLHLQVVVVTGLERFSCCYQDNSWNMVDYYEVLGVQKHASAEDIKKAWVSLVYILWILRNRYNYMVSGVTLLSSPVLLQIPANATLSTQTFELWSWMIAKHINLSASLALPL